MSASPRKLSCYKRILVLSRNTAWVTPLTMAGLLAWVVLWIHLSSLNKSPLPLDHLVTVHDIIDLFSFNCALCASLTSFSLTCRLRERAEAQKQSPNRHGKGSIEVEPGKCRGSVAWKWDLLSLCCSTDTLGPSYWSGEHHLTVLLKWHNLIQWDYFK